MTWRKTEILLCVVTCVAYMCCQIWYFAKLNIRTLCYTFQLLMSFWYYLHIALVGRLSSSFRWHFTSAFTLNCSKCFKVGEELENCGNTIIFIGADLVMSNEYYKSSQTNNCHRRLNYYCNNNIIRNLNNCYQLYYLAVFLSTDSLT